jgi:uncharacterized protein YbaP (TraB family)
VTGRRRCHWAAGLAAVLLGLAWAPAVAQAPAAVCPPDVAAAGPPSGADDTAGAAPDRGLLWRITRDGRSSYLYATLHVGKPAWQRLGPQVTAALRASDALALEVDPGDPAVMQALLDLPRGTTLPAPLNQRLQQAFERACLPPALLAPLHPVLQATTLTVLEARWLGMDPAFALESVLAAQARVAGLRVVALETAAQQMAALVAGGDAETQALVDQGLRQLEDLSARRVLARLAAAWESGNLAALQDYETWCECVADDSDRAFLRRLNDERNPVLASGIEAGHRQHRQLFAAVGALHMTGPQSLPRLLAARGFAVERVAFGF